MKLLLGLTVLVLVELAQAGTDLHPRGCIYINGRCFEECEEGTHAYAVGCGNLLPEATCKNPHPVEDKRGIICDFSSCYCDPPTVRHETTNKCVKLEDCSKQDGKVEPKEGVLFSDNYGSDFDGYDGVRQTNNMT